MISWLLPPWLSFIVDNWQVTSLGVMACAGLGLVGYITRNGTVTIAAIMIALCLVFAGNLYARGVRDEREREIARITAANERALAEMNEQKERDDKELAALRERVGQTPAGGRLAIGAERAKRIGEIR